MTMLKGCGVARCVITELFPFMVSSSSLNGVLGALFRIAVVLLFAQSRNDAMVVAKRGNPNHRHQLQPHAARSYHKARRAHLTTLS